jgi:hypothetical protein
MPSTTDEIAESTKTDSKKVSYHLNKSMYGIIFLWAMFLNASFIHFVFFENFNSFLFTWSLFNLVSANISSTILNYGLHKNKYYNNILNKCYSTDIVTEIIALWMIGSSFQTTLQSYPFMFIQAILLSAAIIAIFFNHLVVKYM